MMDILKNIDWLTIFSNTTIIGLIICALIKLFSKSFISSLGEKTAELLTTKQKTLIQESVKSEFAKNNIAYEADYTFFNTERNKVCIELFRKLNRVYSASFNLTSLLDDVNDIRIQEDYKKGKDEFDKARKDFFDSYVSNRIFLKEDICKKLEDFILAIGQITNRYILTFEFDGARNGDVESRAILQHSMSELSSQKQCLNEITNIFREIIQPKTIQKVPSSESQE